MAAMLGRSASTWGWGCPVCGDARRPRRQARAVDKRAARREIAAQRRD